MQGWAGAVGACLLMGSCVAISAQSSQTLIDRGNAENYKVYNTTPVILYGPFLLDTSETSTTIEWITDTPCQPKVQYGEGKLDHEVVPQAQGLVPVGTLQRVEIKGLLPGHTYQYRVVSTRVVRLKAYLPDKGQSLESQTFTFTTLDRNKPTASFSFITDTHEDIPRVHHLMKMIDWKTTDFLVTGGDGVNFAESRDQVFDTWLGPVSEELNHQKPLIYARGNHDMRGPFARRLSDYLLAPEGNYYFTRDDGPMHLVVVDTGEDKPDDNHEYAGLLADAPYREEEFSWFKNLSSMDATFKQAPFRVVVMHQPLWGWLDHKNREWTDVANGEGIDLVVAGHYHKFLHIQPGQEGNRFPILVVGQDQVAHVEATANEMKVTVIAKDGSVVDSFVVARPRR